MRVLRVPAVHALAVHASVMRACASHARVACTCCSCPCCACLRCALSCGACGVLVQRSPTPCGARRHRRQHSPDQPLVDPGDLPCPFPILSPIALLLSCIVCIIIPPSLPPFLLVLYPLFCPISCLFCFLPIAYHYSARLPRAALVDVTDPTSIVDPGDLTHSQSHTITLACLYAYAYNAVLTAMDLEVPFNKKWLA